MGKPGVTPLKIARLQSGLFQYEVAAKLGVSCPAYCNAENGRARLTDKDTAKVARILKTPIEVLFPGGEK